MAEVMNRESDISAAYLMRFQAGRGGAGRALDALAAPCFDAAKRRGEIR
jgi:hypothetical protein